MRRPNSEKGDLLRAARAAEAEPEVPALFALGALATLGVFGGWGEFIRLGVDIPPKVLPALDSPLAGNILDGCGDTGEVNKNREIVIKKYLNGNLPEGECTQQNKRC